jgi:hypothetical protein
MLLCITSSFIMRMSKVGTSEKKKVVNAAVPVGIRDRSYI